MLLAGIRVVSVSTIALVSVGVIIGSANLGYLFQNGKQRGILEEVVVGIVISLLLALVFDLVIVAHRPAPDAVEHHRRRLLRRSATPAASPASPARGVGGGRCPMNLLLSALAWIVDPANWVPGSQSPLPIQDRLIEHLIYTAVAIVIAGLIALAARLLHRPHRQGAAVVIAFTGSMRALPTLGVLFFLLMVFGYVMSYDRAPIVGATIAFVILAIPSMLAGAYSGLESVDRQTIDAARANGMTEWQILTQVEIPLALPLIVGGIRASVLQVVATVTIASYAGLGGLGRIITSRHRAQRLRSDPRRGHPGHRPRARARRALRPRSNAPRPRKGWPTATPDGAHDTHSLHHQHAHQRVRRREYTMITTHRRVKLRLARSRPRPPPSP